MRCSSAVVLGTFAIGQAAAANIHNRHASFHARREAAKGDEKVDWDALAYDLKDVKWDQVNWSSVFASSATKPTPTPEEKKPVASAKVTATATVTPTPEPKKETPAPSSTKAADSPKPVAPSSTPGSTGNVVTDTFQGVQALANELGIKVGMNQKAGSGAAMYVSGEGKWGMDITNSGSKYAMWYCWEKNGFSGMIVTQNAPLISVGLNPGETTSLSFSDTASGACAAVQSGTSFKTFGGVQDTWAEFTIAGKWSTFNVSKNVNMSGRSVSMKGSQCTANMSTCVFQCKNTNVQDCQFGYDLINCDKSNGGGGGYDPNMQGVGGGCTMNENGDRLTVSFT